jgi:integrase
MALSDLGAKNAKPRPAPYKLTDSGGLYLLVQPPGGKLWRLDYRFLGKRKTLALGKYPAIGLADARRARDAAKDLLEKGTDPAAKRKTDKLVAKFGAGNSFRFVADEYVAKMERERRAEVTVAKARWLLAIAYQRIGDRPIGEITAPELLTVLRILEARGNYESAKRLRSLCGRVFRYAIATGVAARDPSADLKGAITTPTVAHRAAIIDPAGIGALLRAIDSYQGMPVTKAALQLAPLLFVRPGELRHAQWDEFDLAGAVWTIAAAKMKMKRPHIVPLARQTLVILNRLRPLTGDGTYLFPSARTLMRPISENTVNAALRRLGYSEDEMTGHGFRSMASTRLNEMGNWKSDAIERQLAHGERDQIRAAYNHAQYLPERIVMMQAWADYLDALKATVNIAPAPTATQSDDLRQSPPTTQQVRSSSAYALLRPRNR